MCGKIQRRRTSVADDVRSGQSSTVLCTEIKEQVYQRIRNNRRINADENASKLNVGIGNKQR